MENQVDFLEPLIENAREYGKTSLELYKLRAIEKSSEISSIFISRLVAFYVFGLFILMVSFGLAFWLGDFMGKVYLGFLCVGGFYGVTGAIIYFFMHNWMKERTNQLIIKQMFNSSPWGK